MSFRFRRGLPAYVINLDGAEDRWEHVRAAFAKEADVRIERQPGVLTSALPEAAITQLSRGADLRRGTLGCFLAHCCMWERMVKEASPWAWILEDDATPRGLGFLFQADIPDDADIIWTSVRSDPAGRRTKPAVPRIAPLVETLRSRIMLATGPATLGADGYLLSLQGARKLLSAVRQDGFSGHVDWRLVRYGLPEADREQFGSAHWFWSAGGMQSRRGDIAWGIVNAYTCSPAVTGLNPRFPSLRKREDEGAPAAASQDAAEAAT